MVSVSSGLPCLIAATRFSARSMNGRRSTPGSARGRAGADLALVEREHRKPFERLVEKSSSSAITSAKKMFGLLPPSSSVTGIRFWRPRTA
jgi:hypothetical protein